MLASKHLDPVIGIDVHIVLIPSPAGPIPTPIPHPFVGMVFDPMDYVPILGATVMVNGLPRAQAGTGVLAMPPHIPMGGPFMKPPANEGQVYMGSLSVAVDGEPMTYSGLPVLTCTDIGMPAPPRKSKKSAAKSLLLPTSTVISIPGGGLVMVGGAPTISLPGPESRLGSIAKQLSKVKRLRRLAGKLSRKGRAASRYLNRVADRVFDKLKLNQGGIARNVVRRAICTVTGHPVDVASGKLFTDFVDMELLGPLPFKLERVWYSTSTYDGPLGHGWHASFDLALAADEKAVGVRLEDGRIALFSPLQVGQSQFNRDERLTLHRDADGYRLHSASSGLTHRFFSNDSDVLPLSSIEDRSGHAIRFRYDRGRLSEIVDSGGRIWSLTYHAESRRIATVIGPHPELEAERVVYLRYAYNDSDLCEVRDALDQPQRFTYDRHLLVRETNRNGLSFYFEYDAKDHNARCVHTWGDGGIYNHKLTYAHNITTVENSLGHKTVYEHDGAMVHRELDAFGNQRLTKYGEGYCVIASVDELGRSTTCSYDERGNLTESVQADGSTTKIEYAHDLPTRMIDANGGEWSWQYDARGREVLRRDPLGQEVRRSYEEGLTIGRTQLRHDAQGNLVTVVEANGARTRFQHDRLGRVTAVEDARGARTTTTLDLRGRQVEVHEPDGNVRKLAYDAEDNLVHAKDSNSEVRMRYCGMNRLAARSEAGTEVRFEYDTEEQLTAVINEHNLAYRFEIGPTGQVDLERGFDGRARRYQRDAAGRVTRVLRPGERWSAYQHDELGRVKEVEHFDGTKESYVYDLGGSLLSASNDDATVDFERDAVGRIVREKQGRHWIASEYDEHGARVRMHSSMGVDQHIERNAVGDVLGVAELGTGFHARFERDPLGDEIARHIGNVHSRWQRDTSGRPREHVIENGTTLRATGYHWSPNDRLHTRIDGQQGPTRFKHDTRGNLVLTHRPDGTTEARIPDAVGNLYRSEARDDRKYGPAGELLTLRDERGDTHCAYDEEGNLLTSREPNGATWHYAWNAAGHLSAVTRPDGTMVAFKYDPLGRRIAKTHTGKTTQWLWDGNVPLHEWTDRQAPTTWLFDADTFAPLARLHDGTSESIITDHLSTPVIALDDAGNTTWSADIDTYGALHNITGARDHVPLRWPGQYEDAETGLYYNRFRYYDPRTGQYTSQDPIGLAGGDALYAYPEDPLIGYDSLGLKSCVHASRSARKGAYYEAVRAKDGGLQIISGPLSRREAQARTRSMMRSGDAQRGIYTRRRRDARDLAASSGRGRPMHHAAHVDRETGSKVGRFAHYHPHGDHGGHVWFGEAF